MWWRQRLDLPDLRSPNFSLLEALKKGFVCANIALTVCPVWTEHPQSQHTNETQRQKGKKYGGGGNDEEWGGGDEEKTTI